MSTGYRPYWHRPFLTSTELADLFPVGLEKKNLLVSDLRWSNYAYEAFFISHKPAYVCICERAFMRVPRNMRFLNEVRIADVADTVTLEEMKTCRGVGPVTLAEIYEAFAANGYALRAGEPMMPISDKDGE